MNKVLPLLAVPLALWAQDKITVQSSSPTVSYALSEIAKVVVRPDSAIFSLASGGRYAAPTLGQKWTFGASGVVPIQSPSIDFGTLKWSVQGSMLSLVFEGEATVSLYQLNGQLALRTIALNSWEINLDSPGPYILNIQNTKGNRHLFIQGIK